MKILNFKGGSVLFSKSLVSLVLVSLHSLSYPALGAPKIYEINKDPTGKTVTGYTEVDPKDAKEGSAYAVFPEHLRPSQEGLGETNVREILEDALVKGVRISMVNKHFTEQDWNLYGKNFLDEFSVLQQGKKPADINEGIALFKKEMADSKGKDIFGEETRGLFKKMVDEDWVKAKPENQKLYADALYEAYKGRFHNPAKQSPGVITPEGLPTISDGHHGLLTSYLLMQMIKNLDPTHTDDDFKVNIKLIRNFKAAPSQYSSWLMELCKNRRMYFSLPNRHRIISKIEKRLVKLGKAKKNSEKLVLAFEKAFEAVIPKSISEMDHDAMRSFVGALLPFLGEEARNHRAHLSNDNMVDYAEFLVADFLLDRGLVPMFDAQTLQLSPPDKTDPAYHKKMVEYARFLVTAMLARDIIFRTHAAEFEKFLADSLFDQKKFDENKSKPFNPDPREQYRKEKELYEKTYSRDVWDPKGLGKNQEGLAALKEVSPDFTDSGKSPVPEALPAVQVALLDKFPEMKEMIEGGTCLNPANEPIAHLFRKKAVVAPAAAVKSKVVENTQLLNKLDPATLQYVIKGLESGNTKFSH